MEKVPGFSGALRFIKKATDKLLVDTQLAVAKVASEKGRIHFSNILRENLQKAITNETVRIR